MITRLISLLGWTVIFLLHRKPPVSTGLVFFSRSRVISMIIFFLPVCLCTGAFFFFFFFVDLASLFFFFSTWWAQEVQDFLSRKRRRWSSPPPAVLGSSLHYLTSLKMTLSPDSLGFLQHHRLFQPSAFCWCSILVCLDLTLCSFRSRT